METLDEFKARVFERTGFRLESIPKGEGPWNCILCRRQGTLVVAVDIPDYVDDDGYDVWESVEGLRVVELPYEAEFSGMDGWENGPEVRLKRASR